MEAGRSPECQSPHAGHQRRDATLHEPRHVHKHCRGSAICFGGATTFCIYVIVNLRFWVATIPCSKCFCESGAPAASGH